MKKSKAKKKNKIVLENGVQEYNLETLSPLFTKLEIQPKNIELYKTALIHKSYSGENNLKTNYERLEFLGDSVLGLAVSDYLFKNYNLNEGEMTEKRKNFVCENANFFFALEIGLDKFILVGKGALNNPGYNAIPILNDSFEAIIGAIYIDLGFEVAKTVIQKMLVRYINNPEAKFNENYKGKLIEYVQSKKMGKLEYIEIELKNNEINNNQKFKIALMIDDYAISFGFGSSKKEAEQDAARIALEILEKK